MSRAAARSKVTFVCQNCGTVSNRWQGKCDGCNEWNSLVEESTFGGIAAGPAAKRLTKGRVVAQGTPDELREQTGQTNLEDAFVHAIGSEEGLFL